MTNDAVILGCRQGGKYPYIEMRNPLNSTAKAKLFINMIEWNRVLEVVFKRLPKERQRGFLAWLGFDPDNLPEVILYRPQFDGRQPWSDVLSLSAFAALMGVTRGAVSKMCDAGKLPFIEMSPPKTGTHAVRWIYMPAWNGAAQMAFERQSLKRGRPYEAWLGVNS